MTEGTSAQVKEIPGASYIGNGDGGMNGGGTYTDPYTDKKNPTIADYENIFGPAARDVKLDLQRNKRHARWHLPDALKGSNPWLTDRIDGLITDTTGSPFTTKILPYKYIENVDQKIKWNAWSFDEGLASRVPYESAARTLTQTKRSYAGYTIRQGLAITMEHNFMMSEKGRENFKNQLQQIVGSIQYTNDIDVHIALITAPSYAKERAEKYYTQSKTNHQIVREYIDLFGFMSKNPNAMDIMIEEAKAILRSWGAKEPDFLLTNSKLTFQMTMTPEKTQYITQGLDGQKRLKAGPDISSYRGLNIINTRSFSLEDGAPPRDVLRRRVRVAEYHRIPWEKGIEKKHFSFYDESKDAWQKYSWHDLFRMSTADLKESFDSQDAEWISTKLPPSRGDDGEYSEEQSTISSELMGIIKNPGNLYDSKILVGVANDANGGETFNDEELHELFGSDDQFAPNFVTNLVKYLSGNTMHMNIKIKTFFDQFSFKTKYLRNFIPRVYDISEINDDISNHIRPIEEARWEIVIVRPNIEHNMLGIIMGRGGIEDLGATLWGQTELSVYDDSMHGIWGMSYKYNERAIVFNQKNLIRLWDVAYDGYNGGKDTRSVEWNMPESREAFEEATYDVNKPYEGASMMVMAFKNINNNDPWPSPIVFHDDVYETDNGKTFLDGEHVHAVKRQQFRVFDRSDYQTQYRNYYNLMPDFSKFHNPKSAGSSSEENETSSNCLAFQGTHRVHEENGSICEVTGNGHHGQDFVGSASIRAGKGIKMAPNGAMSMMHMI